MQQLYEEAAKRQDGGGSLLDRAARLQEKLESSGLYQVEYEMERVAGGLGVSAMGLDTPIENLSGGEQSKVKLAQLSLQRSHLLVLDEPTNHLDHNAKEALIRAVQDFAGAVIMVTHEAGFYERITDWVIELR
ncbi:MAG: ATP-binding cassette domain-containing protein, partial [Firmicutes bacterium]|nr:ATP-binding cassette domain-containing protein [Bacillota bacterium]